MWYRTGTVTVTNGSAVVTGAGTNFVDNVSVGEIFVGPDLRVYEIVQVVSATDLRITPVYQAGNAGNQGYAIAPTQSFARDLALSAAALLNTFAGVRDGVGQGLFPDGTTVTPGFRFTADQDTGLRRKDANTVAVVSGGVDRVIIGRDVDTSVAGDGARALTMATMGAWKLAVFNGQTVGEIGTSKARLGLQFGEQFENAAVEFMRGGDGIQGLMGFRTTGVERARFDEVGNFLVGATSGSAHVIARATNEGDKIADIIGAGGGGIHIFRCNAGGGNGAATGLSVDRNTSTGRSINAPGTINGSGADYAEYMVKAAGCGIIAKGDVCGVDRDGRLTKTWADAVSFVIKSTDPSLVGGDTWDAEVGPKPEQPGTEPGEPRLLAAPAEDADDATITAWRDAMAAYPAQVARYQAAHAEWQKATDAYAKALPVWEAAHEKARQCVDRIAFCGQVPANVTGDFEVGDYIIAAASGAGIKAVAVKEDDMTLPQYMRRIGKVWAIRDGRAWIDVQHG